MKSFGKYLKWGITDIPYTKLIHTSIPYIADLTTKAIIRTMKTAQLLTLLTGAVFAAGSIHAAEISWGSPTNITGDPTDISTNGTVHYTAAGSRVGGGGVTGASVTVNTVEFFDNLTYDSTFVTHNDDILYRTGIFGMGEYQTLLRFVDRNKNSASGLEGVDVPITFRNLIVGNQYEIQIWAADNSNAAGESAMVLGIGDGAAPDPDAEEHVALIHHVGSTGSGQFVIGTFTADATTQQLLTRRYTNFSSTRDPTDQQFVNAYQIRDLGPIPVGQATVTVSVRDLDGSIPDEAATRVKVEGWRGSVFMGTKSANAQGQVTYGSSEVSPGEGWTFVAYYEGPNAFDSYGELWGTQARNLVEGPNPVTIQRNMPCAPAVRFSVNGSPVDQTSQVPVGSTVNWEVDVINRDASDHSVTVQLRADQNKASPYTEDETTASQTVAGNGGTKTFSGSFVAGTIGRFYYAPKVVTAGGFGKTDSWDWVQTFVVYQPLSTVTVSVRDQDGAVPTEAATRVKVEGWLGSEFKGTKSANAQGLVTYGSSEVSPGEGWTFVAYYEGPNAFDSLGELWGTAARNLSEGPNAITIQRDMPYASAVRFSVNGSPVGQTSQVPVGSTVNWEVDVANPGLEAHNVTLKFRMDRNKASPYDLDVAKPAQTATAGGGVTTFSGSFVASSIGTYHYAPWVDSGPGFGKTDGWDWVQTFVVYQPLSTVTVSVVDLDGNVPEEAATRVKVEGWRGSEFKGSKSANAQGQVTYGSSEVSPGEGWTFVAYYEGPNAFDSYGELWGSQARNLVEGPNPVTIQRNMPYASAVRFSVNGSPVGQASQVPVGSTVNWEVDVTNRDSSGRSVTVQLRADQNQTSPYDEDETTVSQTVLAKGVTTFSGSFVAETTGRYYYAPKVVTAGGFGKTDSWDWVETFSVAQTIEDIDLAISVPNKGSDFLDVDLSIVSPESAPDLSGAEYEVSYRREDQASWTTVVGQSFSFRIPSLESVVVYVIRARIRTSELVGGWSNQFRVATSPRIIIENNECIVFQGPREGFTYSESMLEEWSGFVGEHLVSEAFGELLGLSASGGFILSYITITAKLVDLAIGEEDPRIYSFLLYPNIVGNQTLLGYSNLSLPEWEPVYVGASIEMRGQENDFSLGLGLSHTNFFALPISPDRDLLSASEISALRPGNHYTLFVKNPIHPKGNIFDRFNRITFRSMGATDIDDEISFSAVRRPEGKILSNFRGTLSDGGYFSILGVDDGTIQILMLPNDPDLPYAGWSNVRVADDGTFSFVPELPLLADTVSGSFSQSGGDIEVSVELVYNYGANKVTGQATESTSPTGLHDLISGSYSLTGQTANAGPIQASPSPFTSFFSVGSDGLASAAIEIPDEVIVANAISIDPSGAFSFVTSTGASVTGQIESGEVSISVVDSNTQVYQLTAAEELSLSAYSGWSEYWLTSTSLADRDADADPDLDQRSNAIEFFQGTDPEVPEFGFSGAVEALHLEGGDTHFEFSLPMVSNLIGVDYWIEESDDAATWTRVPTERTRFTDEGNVQRFGAVDWIPGERRFFRARVNILSE